METSYGVWFLVDDKPLQLPVNPTELTIENPGEISTYNVIGIGETVIPRLPKLRKISLDSFFPKTGVYQTMVQESAWYEPEYYVDFFRRLQTTKAVFKIIVERASGFDPMFDTNMSAIIEDFSYTDKGGEPGDVYYHLSVSEWKDMSPEKFEIKKEGVVGVSGETVKPTELVITPQRAIPDVPLTVGQTVTITGNVYETEETTAEMWMKSKRTLTQVSGIVSRVLPPAASGPATRVLISGIGWVEKADCVTANGKNAYTNVSVSDTGLAEKVDCITATVKGIL